MLREADRYRFVADAGYTRDEISRMQRAPVPADRGSVVGRVALEGRTIHVQDVKSDPEYTFWTARFGSIGEQYWACRWCVTAASPA
jgi:two-component system, NtrC family, sensor kinase